jgi:hypothetical protein
MAWSRRWLLAGMVALSTSLMACNPLTLTYFLLVGMDPKYDAEFKIAGADPKKPVKVVVLTSAPLELRREVQTADRELAMLFSQKLQEGCQRNKETNVVLASSTLVQKFKDENPGWQSMTLAELGKRLKADYVIDLEINEMTLYEPGSNNTLFLGKTAISVTVVDVHKPDEGAVFTKPYATEYPRSGSRPVSETNPSQFRRAFLTKVASELSWLFTAHPTADNYSCE